MKSKPRIFFSLLALCYLEIVLWTACLAANGGAIEGHKYLQRETGNLKAFTGVSHPTPDLIDELALAICEHHTALEHLCLQQQFNAWSVITSAILQQPHAQSLRAFPAVQGLPAPFTGVQAID